MSAEEVRVGNTRRFKSNHQVGGALDSREVLQPPSRRPSEEKPSAHTHQSPLLSMLTNQRQTSEDNGEDGMAAATAEAMKNFIFERTSRNFETNKTQQRRSTSYAPLNPELPRNGPAPFLATRHPRQFIPQKSSNEHHPMQEKESRAVAKPEKLRHEAPLHSTHLEAQRSASAGGVQPDTLHVDTQPSSSVQEVPFHVPPRYWSSSTPDARSFLLSTGSSKQAAYRTRIPGEHSEDPYEEEEQAMNGGHDVQSQDRGLSNDSANEEAAGYYRSSDFVEEQAPVLEQYTEQSQDHAQTPDPTPSQDSAVAASPISGFSAGFAAQFEDYVRTHQQEAQDAEERWKNATIEEWKAGKYEMLEHVRKIVDLTKNHMKRKLTAYRALHDDLDGHKDTLQKRRKLLGKLENDAQQTGKGLMIRLTGK